MTKRPINPTDLAPPIGFQHGWLVEHGEQRTLYLAGQCGYDASGTVETPGDLVAQLDRALTNIGSILRDADMSFEDVVQLNFYVTSRDDYALARKAIGTVWRRHCGRHFPGMAMFQIVSLLDPDARVEIQGVAAR
ncbi:MAG: RidA family protein [Planctomycetes bacterium]|nr:RidA family protein [Planctomycetota bacterium]